MKKTLVLTLLAALAASPLIYYMLGGGPSVWGTFKNPETEKMLKQFVALKEKQAYAATNNVPPEIRAMFNYAERGQWLALSNSVSEFELLERDRFRFIDRALVLREWHGYKGLVEDFVSEVAQRLGGHQRRAKPLNLNGTILETVCEVHGVFNAFVTGDEKYTTEFGRDIIDSIPPGSIYFGGTDPGRYIVTAMCQTRPNDQPLFVLCQNSIGVETYLDYLHSIYGDKIYVPTLADKEALFKEYARFLSTNYSHDVSIQTGSDVMGFNGRLSKAIFDQCPTREFFIEESYPLDWMYPYLEPRGLIFKINRQPLSELSNEIIQRDHDYWRKSLVPKIGAWLREETTVQTVAEFAKKTFSRHDFNGFAGDPQFVQNVSSCKLFSRERSAIGDLYAWRVSHSANDSEKGRMAAEADFAFRQAWALCPYGPEATFRYINFLLAQSRLADALLVAETMAALPQTKDNEQMQGLPAQINQYQREHPASSSAH